MKKNILAILILLTNFIYAQVTVSTDSSYATNSTVVALDINGKNGGVLLPKVELPTLSPTTDIPKEGTVVYNNLEDTTNEDDIRQIGYYIFIDKKWRLMYDNVRSERFIPKRITYTKSTFSRNGVKSGSLIITPEVYNDKNPNVILRDDRSFDVGVHEKPYEKWNRIENYNKTIMIPSSYHENNKILITVDGPISFTNYNYALATFSIGVFAHKVEDGNVVKSIFFGANLFDMDLFGVCTSNRRTASLYHENLPEGEYIIEPVYRLIYSYDYRGGINLSSATDQWDYSYRGKKDDDIRRTRMFIGAPEDTQYYHTTNTTQGVTNYDGSIPNRPPNDCININDFTHQSTMEILIYMKD